MTNGAARRSGIRRSCGPRRSAQSPGAAGRFGEPQRGRRRKLGVDRSGGDIVLPGPLRIPAPNPRCVANRCCLKPLTPETPEKAQLLVGPPRSLTPQVVYRSRPRFQLPNSPSQTQWPTQTPATATRTRLGNAPPGRELLPGLSSSLATTPGQAQKTIQIHRQTASGRRIYSD